MFPLLRKKPGGARASALAPPPGFVSFIKKRNAKIIHFKIKAKTSRNFFLQKNFPCP